MIDTLLQSGLVPKLGYRLGINHAIRDRLRQERAQYQYTQGGTKQALIDRLNHSSVALSTQTANEQHYEVPTAFYQHILGPSLKYSCNYYEGEVSLAEAENAMLALYCERADIRDGQRILDLGCGWGALTLHIAKHYPHCKITAVSNSKTQQAYISSQTPKTQHPIRLMHTDINNLVLDAKYDRIVSIEMFEHVRNYRYLLSTLSQSLNPDGILFVHHFCHQYLAYEFDANKSWMARHFFKDGLMPSEDLLLFFTDDFIVDKRWQINGKHYEKTCYHFSFA